MNNFYGLIRESVVKWPQNVATEIRGATPPGGGECRVERYTYAELHRMAESVGRWLRDRGAERGARAAVLGSNHPRWVAAYLGAIANGGVAVPLDTAFTPKQIAKLLADCGATFLFADSRHLHLAQEAVQDLPVEVVLLDGSSGSLPRLDEIFAAGPGDFVPVASRLDELAVILYTSGTTSDPKGVMLTHENMLAEVAAVLRENPVEIGERDAILGVLPLFHALAQMANLLLPFTAGARVIYLESLNVTDLLRALREGSATLFCCVPQFFYLIHERVMKQAKEKGALAWTAFRLLLKTSRLLRSVGINPGRLFFRPVHEAIGMQMRYLVTGGSRFDPAIGHDLHALGFDLLQAYGLTETSGGAFLTPPRRVMMGSVGKPLYGVEAKIVDPEPQESGPPAGEIAIRGKLVMKAYYRRPEATAEVIRDGWLHTGDLGYFDAGGNLFITGRKKEVIILSSGKNIYPEELEQHYLQSPYIKEICVMGMQSRPGEPFSERLHAVIVPDFELLKQRKIVNAGEVIRFDLDSLSAQLPSAKRILSYEIWQHELPRTTTRKLKRFEIHRKVMEKAERAERQEAPAGRELASAEVAWLQQPEVARAMGVIRRAAKTERRELHPSDNLELDLGLDSMERVELLVALEKELGAHVEDSVVSEVYTVRELVEAVRSGVGATSSRAGFDGWDAVFATESEDPEVLAITESRPVATAAWFLFGRCVNLVARDLFRLQVTGLEKLPNRGPYILCPNHQSFLDAPVLVSLVPWQLYREFFYVGTSEIFGEGFLRRLAKSIKLIPVDPDSNLVPAMRAGAYGLRRGKVLVLYPEGERSIDGRPKTFKKGAAILSVHLKVPIYPVAMEGFHDAWPRNRGFQGFRQLKIAVGDPIYPPTNVEHTEAAYAQITAELKGRVMEMWLRLHGEETPHSQAMAAD